MKSVTGSTLFGVNHVCYASNDGWMWCSQVPQPLFSSQLGNLTRCGAEKGKILFAKHSLSPLNTSLFGSFTKKDFTAFHSIGSWFWQWWRPIIRQPAGKLRGRGRRSLLDEGREEESWRGAGGEGGGGGWRPPPWSRRWAWIRSWSWWRSVDREFRGGGSLPLLPHRLLSLLF